MGRRFGGARRLKRQNKLQADRKRDPPVDGIGRTG